MTGLSTYGRKNKGARRDIYDRPYLTGNYNRDLNADTAGGSKVRRALSGRS